MPPQNDKLSGLIIVSNKKITNLRSEKIGPGIAILTGTHKPTTRHAFKPCIVPAWAENREKDEEVAVFKSLNQEHHLVENHTPDTKCNRHR